MRENSLKMFLLIFLHLFSNMANIMYEAAEFKLQTNCCSSLCKVGLHVRGEISYRASTKHLNVISNLKLASLRCFGGTLSCTTEQY